MKTTTAEILDQIQLIALGPYMYAPTPEEAGGMIHALAAIALAENSKRSLQAALRDVGRYFIPAAMPDVPRAKSAGVTLSDESIEPRRTSFDAVSRHTEALLKLLETFGVSAGRPLPTSSWPG